MRKEVVKIDPEIETELFQIHALAKILEQEIFDNPDHEMPEDNHLSDVRLSLSQIIVEKVESCIQRLGNVPA